VVWVLRSGAQGKLSSILSDLIVCVPFSLKRFLYVKHIRDPDSQSVFANITTIRAQAQACIH
jgi:hypothetical protein